MEEGGLFGIIQPIITMKEDEDVITLSSEGEDNDADVLPIVPAPPRQSSSTTPRRGIEIVHLAAAPANHPKIEPKPKPIVIKHKEEDIHISFTKTSNNQMNGGTSSSGGAGVNGEVITLSSDDEDELPISCAFKSRNPAASASASTSTAQSTSRTDFPKNCTDETSIAIIDEETDADANEVLKDDEDDESTSDLNKDRVESDASVGIQKLLDVLKPKLKYTEKKKLTKKLWKAYNKLRSEPISVHQELSRRIGLFTEKIKQNLEYNFWKYLKKLLKQFDAETLKNANSFTLSLVESPEELEEKKEKLKLKVEKELEKLSTEIKRLDKQDADWDSDNEHRSAYIMGDKYRNRLIKQYNALCKIFNCSKFTGRPVQKAIRMAQTSRYPEIEKAVEAAVNKKGYFEAPDYDDICDAVIEANEKFSLHLTETEAQNLAKTFLEEIINKRQQLRKLDVPFAFPPECDSLHDPAESDAELEEKLRANAKIARTIRSVADDFVEKQRRLEDERIAAGNNNDVESLVDEDSSGDEYGYEDRLDDEESDGSVAGTLTELAAQIGEDKGVPAWKEPLFDDDEDSVETTEVNGDDNQKNANDEDLEDIKEPALKKAKFDVVETETLALVIPITEPQPVSITGPSTTPVNCYHESAID